MRTRSLHGHNKCTKEEFRLTDFEEYQATGMLGGYKPGEIVGGRFGGDNKVMPTFLNTKFSESANGEASKRRSPP